MDVDLESARVGADGMTEWALCLGGPGIHFHGRVAEAAGLLRRRICWGAGTA